jgi:hypothetical protein
LGLFGETESGFKYRLYLVQGLNVASFDKNGIRKGRQILNGKGNADKFGGVGRVEYTGVPGLAVGASYYNSASAGVKDVSVSLWDIDLRYKIAGFDITLLSAQSKINGAENISATQKVGEEQVGQYGEIAYHLNRIGSRIPDIVPFYRVEQFNTHETVPTGVTVDTALDQEVTTYGLAYYPNPDIAFKVDREDWSNKAGKTGDRTNVGVAFMF